jgi:hypothetical protein
VGHEAPFTQAIQSVRAGGTMSSVGVYVEPSMGFPAREAFFKDLTLKMGICNARNYMTTLLPLVQRGKLKPAKIITHTMPAEGRAAGATRSSTRSRTGDQGDAQAMTTLGDAPFQKFLDTKQVVVLATVEPDGRRWRWRCGSCTTRRR